MAKRRLPPALLFLIACPVASAQNPAGPEFRVNSYTTGGQYRPGVASDSHGNFVVVWWDRDGQDGSYAGVFGQRFNAAGTPRGSQFQVNSYTTGNQHHPAVASDPAGNFVVVWTSDGQNGSYDSVFGQRFDASGLPQGSEFQVNSYLTGTHSAPAVASDANANFVVVWQDLDADALGVFGRRFSAFGVPGIEFQVNSYTTRNQDHPAVASDASGNFVVLWTSDGQDGDTLGVFGQSFNGFGVPQGSEFQVSSSTISFQSYPAAGWTVNGDFVVAWHSNLQDGSGGGIFGRRFNSFGLPQGSEFQINSYTTANQFEPAVASDLNGNFVVAWLSNTQDGSGYGVFGQRFGASGLPQGTEFRVNSSTTGGQLRPAVTSNASGDFVVVWEGQGAGDNLGIFGQRFGDLIFRDGFQ